MTDEHFVTKYEQLDRNRLLRRKILSHFPTFLLLAMRKMYSSLVHLTTVKKPHYYRFFPLHKSQGYCPCCRRKTLFVSHNPWLRDHFRCTRCSSLPRDRQVYKYLNGFFGDCQGLSILEFAPLPGSYAGERKYKQYIKSHYFPHLPMGKMREDFYNEDIQSSTFADNSFDIIIHEDVLEHIPDPFQAIRDNFRILKENGVLFFTCPVEKISKTKKRVDISENGEFIYLEAPDYHGNPIDPKGSLVFYNFGMDFIEKLRRNLPENAHLEHITQEDKKMGIAGEYLDLFCVRKCPANYSGKR